MARKKQEVVYLTVDEIMSMGAIITVLLESDGKLKRLAELPISDEYKADLASVGKKLDAKLKEISDGA